MFTMTEALYNYSSVATMSIKGHENVKIVTEVLYCSNAAGNKTKCFVFAVKCFAPRGLFINVPGQHPEICFSLSYYVINSITVQCDENTNTNRETNSRQQNTPTTKRKIKFGNKNNTNLVQNINLS